MRILIVDDEKLARERLTRMLQSMEERPHEVVGEAGNGVEAVALADQTQPDVVLLDIRMPGMDGLEAARHFTDFEEPPAVIFCTAYEEHAVEAFDLQAVGYLLKPVRRENLQAALEQARRLNKAQIAALSDTDKQRRTHISARTRRGIELIAVDDVRYFQADQKYVTVRHGTGEIIIDETLRELEEEFDDRFIRVHRNALIAGRYIEGLDRTPDGYYRIRLRDVEERIEISRRHVPNIRRFVKSL
ncbi:MAG: LytTR family DNA-binding domain-containing protein [Gammaproteobacteria bacterium]|nr:LytTR family DNA-binding domain-containing protein [Gammaproteobacteria bacterium]